MFRCVNLLLLFYFVNYSGAAPVGNTLIPVTGRKGGDVKLSCDFEDREISHIVLSSQSKKILVCENEECENGRVFKEGSCDVIIKDLTLSDAGKYILRVYYKNTELERQIRMYHLHIHDDICVKTGEELKLDVLLINADKVEHQNRRSTEWTEVWRRGHGVSSDRLTVRDETLIIKEFTVTDTGSYRVLDYEGQILITVTVTESRTDLKGKLDIVDIKPDDAEQHTVVYGILSAGMVVFAVLLVLTLTLAVIRKKQNKKADHDSSQGIPMQLIVHEAQNT